MTALKTVRCLQYFSNLKMCLFNPTVSSNNNVPIIFACHRKFIRHKSNGTKDLSSLFQPLDVKPANNSDDINIGAELSTHLKKDGLLRVLSEFYKRPMIKRLAAENGLDSHLYHRAYINFRRYCVESEQLSAELHIVLSDILQGGGHVDDIFPYFLSHSKKIFPHLECMEELTKISDLRLPANWYPDARQIHRKIIFHAGPTNSGKTYHALESFMTYLYPDARQIHRKIIFHAGPTNSGKTYHALESFMTSKSGVYCGPLKLLAAEVFNKSNSAGTACDLVTGEERKVIHPEGTMSDHVACTVEMTSVNTPYDVAVIDEIQMIRDPQRGWAWTRALLGVCAREVHVCGEASALTLIRELALITGDDIEVRKYKRLTKLSYLDYCVGSVDNIRKGDCVVCFSKKDIYNISRQLEKQNKECAVIYGGLPPGAKLAQAQRFNDPQDSCNIMVATDAIGMGLNLSIKRIVFYSLIRPHLNDKGEKEMNIISTSQALQISGRAGRYATPYEHGEVTTFKEHDLTLLKDLVDQPIDPIEQAGLHPTADQIELFAYHLPNATLSNLIDIFVNLSQIDSDKYFMCNIDDFKFLADMIEHVPLPLRVRYVFCCSPIPHKQPFVCTMFLKFARQYSRNEPLTHDWVCRQIAWPFHVPKTIVDLVHLEGVFDVLDLYLWLSYRFEDMLPDTEQVRDMQRELDLIIQSGVCNITRLLQESNLSFSYPDEDEFEMKERARTFQEHPAANDYIDWDMYENDDPGRPRERLTDKLVRQGLLTKDMVTRLQKELGDDASGGAKVTPRRK